MKNIFHFTIALSLATILFACSSEPASIAAKDQDSKTISVNAALFLSGGLAENISTVACTLSDGSSANCFKIVSKSTPTDHNMGPWCPTNISDSSDAGGIWLEAGYVHDVDGNFINDMAEFYKDDAWQMSDSEGNIKVTSTKKECEEAANPRVGPEYASFCVECLPAYVADLTQTYLIPVKPLKLESSVGFANGPRGSGVSVRGLAFNGVRFDAPAPTHAILGAHTLAPFDDAGGHINLHAGYHYHAATGQTTKVEQKDGHAAMIGYAMDGYGLFEQLDEAGNKASDLDECRGHYDDVRGYHYHVDKAGANNFIGCLRGAYAKE